MIMLIIVFAGRPSASSRPQGSKSEKKNKKTEKSAGNGVRHGNALTIFMHIVRAIACLTPFPAEFITIMPVGLRPPGGPGGQKSETFCWKWSQVSKGSNNIRKYIKNTSKMIHFEMFFHHETDLEMSPRPLGTTVFEEIYIRTMGK